MGQCTLGALFIPAREINLSGRVEIAAVYDPIKQKLRQLPNEWGWGKSLAVQMK